jgi:hypothetical protein
MFRKFSGLAIWAVLGLALALAPLACSSDTATMNATIDAAPDHATADSATRS